MTEIKLTGPQQKAIRLMPKHNVQLIACAGSGKTEIVSRGVAEIIRQGTRPEHIVAFTFTEKAAEELKARIRKILVDKEIGDGSLGDMYVGTIHSFCFERLKELAPEFRAYDVLDEATRIAYVSKPYNYYNRMSLKAIESNGYGGKYRTIGKFIDSVDIALDEGLRVSDIKAKDKLLGKSLQQYRDCLDEDRYLDFGSMINELVVRLERNKKIRKALQERTRFLVVDEYQDVNALQERLIKAMVGKNTKIIVVGDDDQSIYAWRGAVVDNILNFENRYDDVKKIRLETNFRSSKRIIELANGYIEQNSVRQKKKMKFPENGKVMAKNTDIQYRHFDTEEEQADFIADRINELAGSDFVLKNGKKVSLDRSDVAILVRANADLKRLLPLLEARDIEYVVDSGQTIFDQDVVQKVHACLDYIFNLSDYSVDDLVKGYRQFLKGSEYSVPRAATILKEIMKLRQKLDRISQKDKKDYLPNLGLQGVFHELLQALQMHRVELSEPDHYYLATFSQAISDYEQVWQRLRHAEYKYFKGFITAWGENAYSVGAAGASIAVDAVKVLTIHKAKGLEFPVVFIPYLNQKRKNNRARSLIDNSLFDAKRYIGDEEDERRLYYVALTRAQKFLFLSGMAEDPTVKNPRQPLHLIGELNEALLDQPRVLKPRKSGYPPRKQTLHDITTSFSELSAYGRCGYDYKLRHVFGYNAGVPVAFGYGTQIHNILNIIHSKYRDDPLSIEQVETLVEENFYLRFAPGNINEHLKKAAVNVVKHYVHNHSDEFKDVLETEKSFEFSMGDALITGQIDLVKRLDSSGALQEVEVVDFKSDKRLLYKKDSAHQLRLYVMACLKSLGLSPQRACIHDLESDEKRIVDIGDADMKATEVELHSRITGIREERYTPTNDSEICGGCDYNRICTHCKAA